LINMYGITETTVHTTYYPITLEDAKGASGSKIGKRIPDLEVYIFDRHEQIVPVGIAGELYIGGAGLARGYLNRPELTEERFVPHPFKAGERLYRTGDLVRYLPDGNLEFMGRIDHQVKIRGFRIELGEIEAALQEYPSIKEAVVLVREDEPGDKRLVAYVVGAGSTPEWREHLKAQLPSYMVPSHFVEMETLPLTSNGKIDRKALPIPEEQAGGGEGYVAPRSQREQILASIWEGVLGVKPIGVYDNFFETGGDSILSIQIVSRANQAGLQLTPKQMFEFQTIAELAQVAGEAKKVFTEQGVITGEVPLTPIQQWFFEQNHPNPNHWNQSMVFRTQTGLNLQYLQEALEAILIHHDALRMRFTLLSDGKRNQSNQGMDEQVSLDIVHLDNLSQEKQNEKIRNVVKSAQSSLCLQDGPLMRVVYFDEGDGLPGRLFWGIHHLVVDGVSWRILIEDLQTAYDQIKENRKVELPSKSTSFKEWSRKLHAYGESGVPDTVREFWKQQAEVEVETLSPDYTVPKVTEASTEQHMISFGEEETRALLQDVPVAYRTKVDEVLLTALVQSITQLTGLSSISVHMEGHGREEILDSVDISRTIGWFTSIYPVHFDLRGVGTPIEALKLVKRQVRQIPNKGVDYQILRYLNSDMGSLLSSGNKPSISFNYLGQFQLGSSQTSLFSGEQEWIGFDHDLDSRRPHLIDVVGSVMNGRLQITWMYSHKQFDVSTIQDMAEKMRVQLNSFINQPVTEEAFIASDFADAKKLTEKTLSKVLSKLKKKRG
ncbi:non-ribosomal peptide synthase domain TIGR01720, partial [Thermoactinomyces sp. DSM 45892]